MNLSQVAEAVQNQGITTDNLRAMIKAQGALIEELRTDAQRELLELAGALTDAAARIEVLETELEDLKGAMNGYEVEEVPSDETDEQRATRVGVASRLSDLEHFLKGRNRSAPVKRNMTDDDARRVLTGDVKELGHKEAGEGVGLTYAQVYSCRLEYTFKHVHKELRDGGWKNPWAQSKR